MTERVKKTRISSVFLKKIFNINLFKNKIVKMDMILYVLCFFISRNSVAEELFPFAVSFLCAYFFYKGHSLLILVISSIGILSAGGNPIYLAALFIAYIYFLRNKNNEQKNILYISILAASVVFLLKTALLIVEGFSFDKLFINIFESMLVISSIYILKIGISSLNIVNYLKKDGEKTVCFFITIFLAFLGLQDLYIFNFSVLKCIEYFIIPFCASYLGPAVGAVTGFIFGFLNGTTINDTAYYATALSFGGLLTGFLCNRYRIYGGIVFTLVSSAVIYYFGIIRILKGDVIELIIGFIIYFAIVILNDRKIKKFINRERPKNKIYNTYNKLTRLSSAIEEICSAYREGLEKESYKGTNEIDEIINEVYGKECLYCSKHNNCWKNNFNKTYYTFAKIVKNVCTGKRIIGDNYLKRIGCKNYNEIIKSAYKAVSKFETDSLRQNEIKNSKKAVVDQLLETSLIINDTAKEIRYEDIRDKKAINSICRELEDNEIQVKHFDISGRNDNILISLTFSTNNNLDKVIDNIIDIIYKITGLKIYCLEKTISIDQYFIVKFRSKKKLKAKSYYARISKGNCRISGDSFSYGSTEDKYYMILSDGMGSGEKAFNESKSTVDILSKLTEANFQEKQLLKTMNSLLMLKFDDETYTTIDLSILDIDEHEIRFYKAGAAPSYMIKDDKVIIVDANSLPVGILDDADFQFNRSKISSGNIIVMVTDGIIDSINKFEEKSLERYLETIKHENPQNMANLILTYAMRGCKEIIDDMTVLITIIE